MLTQQPPKLDGRVFGMNARLRRGELGLSQEEVAARAEVGIATIRAIEGQHRPNLRAGTAGKLAAALDTTVKELYGIET